MRETPLISLVCQRPENVDYLTQRMAAVWDAQEARYESRYSQVFVHRNHLTVGQWCESRIIANRDTIRILAHPILKPLLHSQYHRSKGSMLWNAHIGSAQVGVEICCTNADGCFR